MTWQGWRPATDGDADALIGLIGAVYAEYPGCVLDLGGIDADLHAIATHLGGRGGRLWIVQDERGATGCAGYAPSRVDGRVGVELKRLYVRADARGRGLGRRLAGLVEAEGRERGARVIEAWSDTRFLDAHRLYESLGYVRRRETRDLHDPSHTIEHHFVKRLD